MKRKGCAVCGNELPRRRTKFCSMSCATYYEMKRREKRLSLRSLLPTRVCVYCGDKFEPKSERHIYCKKTCWGIVTANKRKKKRERHKALGIDNTVWNRQTKTIFGTAGSGNKWRKTGQCGHKIEIKIPVALVNTASFTPSDTEERVELRTKVEEYLENGGKITKYGAQPSLIQEEILPSWQVSEHEEQEAVDDYREENVFNGY